MVQGVASKGYWVLLFVLLLLLPPQTAATETPAESQGESPPIAPEEVPAVEVLGQEEHSYNTSSVQGDSPLVPDDADDFLPPITSTEPPLENPSPPGEVWLAGPAAAVCCPAARPSLTPNTGVAGDGGGCGSSVVVDGGDGGNDMAVGVANDGGGVRVSSL